MFILLNKIYFDFLYVFWELFFIFYLYVNEILILVCFYFFIYSEG